MDQQTKALTFTAFVLLLLTILIAPTIGNNSKMVDYVNIWSCIKTGKFSSGNTEIEHLEKCESYPGLIVFLGKAFSSREIFYKYFLLFLFAFIMPLVLFKITNNWISTFFYFSTTNYFWALLTSSFFAQALSILLVFSLVFLKEWQKIVVLVLLIIAHSTGFILGLVFVLVNK